MEIAVDRFFSGEVGPVPAMALIAVALVCTVTDLWKGRIYNAVTYTAMIAGAILQIALHGGPGVWLALGGFAVGFFPAFLLFALGGLGGGDVKLLGAIGILAGPVPTTEILIFAFVVGGFFALVKLAWQGTLWRTMWRTLRYFAGLMVPGLGRTSLEAEKRVEIRFGLAICVSVFAVLWSLHHGGFLGALLGPA